MRPRNVKGFNGENRFRSFETLARRPSETRSCAGSTRAHHGSTSGAPLVTNYPRPLDRVTVTGMVSANAFQSFATELARILIGGERERAIDTKRVDRPLILERRSWIGRRTSMDGIGPIPRPKFSIEPRSNKVRFRGWLREDGGRGRRIARNGDCRERGNQRRRPRFATNNLWLKLFRSPSPPADTPWPTTSAVTRGPRFQSRTADVLVLVLLVFGTGEGGHSRGDFVSFSVKKSRYPINPRGK